jgi:hypothetical protein
METVEKRQEFRQTGFRRESVRAMFLTVRNMLNPEKFLACLLMILCSQNGIAEV